MQNRVEVNEVTDQADLETVFAIRRKVFVDEQNCPPELEWEFEDESTHFLGTVNDIPAGAARWRETEKGFKLERFAVLPEFRGSGMGKALVGKVLESLPESATYIYLNAQLTAIGLYEKFGFVKEGPQFEEAGIQHFKMVRKNNS
ncbi:MAG: GNAT family N-acetyltransferase [Bacteroidota bacterium]